MAVSVFRHFNEVVENLEIPQIISQIKNGEVEQQITVLRNLVAQGDKIQYDKAKKTLLAFTPSAQFEGGRTLRHLLHYSGYIILDIDDLPPALLQQVKDKAILCPYTYACFISPGGEGLKIIVATNATLATHKKTFVALQKYYENLLKVFIDDSGKDPTRLCFYSFDPDAYLNNDAQIFDAKNPLQMDPQKNIADPQATFEHCKRYTNKKKTYSAGNRNNYIHFLASNCNRNGLAEADTLNFISVEFDLPQEEIKAAVASAYKNIAEHNTNQYDEDKPKPPAIDLVEKFLTDRYEFRNNIVTSKLEYKAHSENTFRTINDYKENSLLKEIQKARLKCNMTSLRGILGSDFCKIFNPFTNYFFSLEPWDGTTDYIKELAKTITTTDQEFWEYCFKKWIVAMVATAIDDKITNHTVIVFSGKQGLGKTTWIENLVPFQLKEHLFSGTINPNNKDTLCHLAECLLINLDELENLNKSEIGSLKELITKSHIRIRKAYGHNNESLPRRASFAASVNTAQFLNDTTGSRRFLCFEVLSIEYQHKIDISKVFAQALHLYNSGFQFWFDKQEIESINHNNEQYQTKTAEEELLLTWFRKPSPDDQPIYLNTSQIAVRLVDKSKLQFNNTTINHLGKALRKNGFERIKKGGSYVYALYEFNFEAVENESKKEITIQPPHSDAGSTSFTFLKG